MAVLPTLLRRVLVSAMPDAAWAATQVAPTVAVPSLMFADVSASTRIGVVYKAFTTAGAVVNPSGTMDLAIVDVAATVPIAGIASTTVIKTSPVTTGVVAGAGLEYNVSGSRTVTIRINAQVLAGTVAYVEIYWNDLS